MNLGLEWAFLPVLGGFLYDAFGRIGIKNVPMITGIIDGSRYGRIHTYALMKYDDIPMIREEITSDLFMWQPVSER